MTVSVVGAGSSVTIEEGECRQNKVGLIAQDAGTRVQLNKLAASDKTAEDKLAAKHQASEAAAGLKASRTTATCVG